MHRDLKPENILLKDMSSLTDVIIADFGLSTLVNSQNILLKKCGTVGYVAPEVLQYTVRQ